MSTQAFKNLSIGDTFHCNGNTCKKLSSRTADIGNGRAFYFGKDESVFLVSKAKPAYLHHGQGTQGPFRTEAVQVINDKPSAYLAHFEGKLRRVHFQAGKTFIHYHGERIAIQIEGVTS